MLQTGVRTRCKKRIDLHKKTQVSKRRRVQQMTYSSSDEDVVSRTNMTEQNSNQTNTPVSRSHVEADAHIGAAINLHFSDKDSSDENLAPNDHEEVKCNPIQIAPNVSSSIQTEQAKSSSTLLGTPLINLSFGDNPVILVDSREVNDAQDVVSCLRFENKVNVVVQQLLACDYQVSTRMGVVRRTHGDIFSDLKIDELKERVQIMLEYFERPCIIIEKESLKKDEKVQRPLQRTEYTDSLITSLAIMKVKMKQIISHKYVENTLYSKTFFIPFKNGESDE